VQVSGQVDARAGERVEVSFPSSRAHLFAKAEDEPALERLKSYAATPGA
jgi:hypothetical protein